MPEYFIILLSILTLSSLLKKSYDLEIFSSKKHLVVFFLVVFIVGILWDGFALKRGHWSFGDKYLLGVTVGIFPLEEFAFFAIFPYSLLVLYKWVEKFQR